MIGKPSHVRSFISLSDDIFIFKLVLFPSLLITYDRDGLSAVFGWLVVPYRVTLNLADESFRLLLHHFNSLGVNRLLQLGEFVLQELDGRFHRSFFFLFHFPQLLVANGYFDDLLVCCSEAFFAVFCAS